MKKKNFNDSFKQCYDFLYGKFQPFPLLQLMTQHPQKSIVVSKNRKALQTPHMERFVVLLTTETYTFRGIPYAKSRQI